MFKLLDRLKTQVRKLYHLNDVRQLRWYVIAPLLASGAILMPSLMLPPPLALAWPALLVLVVILNSWYGGPGPGVLSAVIAVAVSEMARPRGVDAWSAANDIIAGILLVSLAAVLSSIRRQRMLSTHPVVRSSATQDQTTDVAQIAQTFRDTNVFVLDHGCRYTYVSPSAAQLLIRSTADILGKTLFEVFPDPEASTLARHLHPLLSNRMPVHFEEYLDSAKTWLGFDCYPIRDGLVCTFNDVTETKRQRAQQPLSLWNEDPEFQSIFRKIEFTLVDLARCYILYQLAKQSCELPGDVAEVGVYKGGTAKLLALTISPHANKTVHLFDTFRGMPSSEAGTDHHREGDLGDTTLEAVQRHLRECNNVRFYKGFFPDTAGPIEASRFCMVHIDVDIYNSVKDSCAFFYPRLSTNGIMVFDDYGFSSCPGARKAVDEFFCDKPESPVYLPSGQCLVIKGR